ncbi:T9SS type A sorting domain-containing protein [Epilithonimonas sp. UC225_85]|uniref:T9SS type A sorting domain-containing protein n=1 Tax=Epilithonimonas sp. UC225_85 TaxID=3350167 RepID=UPI0036D22331
MKKLIIILILLFTFEKISAEQYIHISGLNITQINESQIKANLKIALSNGGYTAYNAYVVTRQQNVITLKVCYDFYFFDGGTTPNNDFIIDVPSIPDNYILKVEIYLSGATCTYSNPYLQDSSSLEFTTPFTGTILLSAADGIIKNDKMKLYPNPSNGNLNINTPSPIDNITVLDAAGKQIISLKNPGTKLNLSQLKNGIYFLEIDSNKNKFQEKVVIQK